jgi:hypothetical protein
VGRRDRTPRTPEKKSPESPAARRNLRQISGLASGGSPVAGGDRRASRGWSGANGMSVFRTPDIWTSGHLAANAAAGRAPGAAAARCDDVKDRVARNICLMQRRVKVRAAAVALVVLFVPVYCRVCGHHCDREVGHCVDGMVLAGNLQWPCQPAVAKRRWAYT